MANYIILYLGTTTKPESKEQGQEDQAKWMKWMQDLGDKIVNPGTPLGKSMIISPDGVKEAGDKGITGYSVVEADSLEAAIEMAKDCPYLLMGNLEVAEMKSMGG